MAADIGLDATTSLDEAFAAAMERHGADAKVAVLPFARYQLPRNAVRMASRRAEPARARGGVTAHGLAPCDVTTRSPALRPRGVRRRRRTTALGGRDPRLDDDPRDPPHVSRTAARRS